MAHLHTVSAIHVFSFSFNVSPHNFWPLGLARVILLWSWFTQVKTALHRGVCLTVRVSKGATLTSLCISVLLINGDCNISDKNELFCIQSNLQQEDSCKNYTAIQTVKNYSQYKVAQFDNHTNRPQQF